MADPLKPAESPAEPRGAAVGRPRGLVDFVRHLHPSSVRPSSLEPTATLGLGMICLALCGVLLLSGLLLMVYYVPHASHAYASIQDLHAVIPFGGFTRAVHRWAGHALVVAVGLHLLRTLLTGAYKGRRRRGVWTAGIWLLVLTLAFAFTGYLLPWDQLSYWAVAIGGHLAASLPLVGDLARRALLGGVEVGNATLVRFYALHVGILPAVTTALLVVHLYRLRRAGGLAGPDSQNKPRRLPSWPHLYERELAVLLLVVAAVLLAALVVDAPLGPEPDPAHPEDPSKAPWYFLFLQELVSYSSTVGGVLLPLAALVLLYLVPFVERHPSGQGRWLWPAPASRAFGAGMLSGLALVAGSVGLHEGTGASLWLDPATALCAGTLLAGAAAFAYGRKKIPEQAQRLTILVLAGLGTSALVLLTVVAWYRGPSWSLVLPWGAG